MKIALNEARSALSKGNIPVGACIVVDGEVITTAHNQVDSGCSDLRHAELNALKNIEHKLFDLRGEIALYSTLEPCLMCLGAILNSGISSVIYGASDNLVGTVSLISGYEYYASKAKEVIGGVLASESQKLLNEYVETYGVRRHLHKEVLKSF